MDNKEKDKVLIETLKSENERLTNVSSRLLRSFHQAKEENIKLRRILFNIEKRLDDIKKLSANGWGNI